jgi:hypothetical protein
MKRLSRIAAAIVSLTASGALFAQSVPPSKPADKDANTTVAQNQPAPGGASSGAAPADADHGPSGTTLAVVGLALGAAVIAAAASVHNSSTTHH